MINIVLTIDNRLQNRIWNCYNSIIRNTKEKVQFYIICSNVEKKYIELYEKKGFHVFIGSDFELEKIKFNDDFVSSPALYNRFLIPDLIDTDKCIYAEVDSVFNCDIKDYWHIDIEDNYFGAVKDPFWNTCEQIQHYSGRVKENINLNVTPYLTGNIIMNLKKMREDNISKKMIDFVLKNNVRVNLTMSYVCRNKIKQLENKWCMLASHKEFSDINGIYHWSGKRKPWIIKSKNYNIWQKYS